MRELVAYGFLTDKEYEIAETFQLRKGCKMSVALIKLGFLTSEDIETYSRIAISKR